MLPEVRNYLGLIQYHLRLDPSTEKQVICEFYDHIEEKIAELQAKGIPEKEAAKAAMDSFGRPRVVARMMYEACGQGNPTDATIALLPHLLVAGLFAFHLWDHALLASIVLISIMCATLFGWWHGKPNWLYSWIGYSLTLLLVGGYALVPTMQQSVSFFKGDASFPNIGMFVLISALAVFSLGGIIRITIRVVKRDWLLASLMLVPFPIVGSWLFNVQIQGLLHSSDVVHQWDQPMALACAVLGVMAAAFIRFRSRVLKIGAVIALSFIALVMVVQNIVGGLTFWGLVGLFIFILAFLFSPALMEKQVGHGEEETIAWWNSYPEHSQ